MSFAELPTESTPQARSSLVTWLGMATIALGVFLYLVFRRGEAAADPRRATEHPAVGVPLPTISLEPLTGDGQPIRAAQLAGKVVLLNFWGPWCGYCVAELPDLAAVAQQYAARGDFVFLPATYANHPDYGLERLRQDTRDTMVRIPGLTTTYSDPSQATLRAAYQIGAFQGGFPTTILLDRHGVVRAVWNGVVSREDLEFVLQEHW